MYILHLSQLENGHIGSYSLWLFPHPAYIAFQKEVLVASGNCWKWGRFNEECELLGRWMWESLFYY